ncbi:MAG: hypothetical protein H6745_24975 [Deltaproteobacteria bacterium]|nr:hypothetical protein [Deltaproteobacteria bacterium]
MAAGGGAVIAGAICLVVAEGYNADLRDIKDTAVDGVVSGTPRKDAVALQDRAQAWTTAGWITAGAGALTAAIGVGWLLAAPSHDDRARVDVRAALTPGGLAVTARGAF